MNYVERFLEHFQDVEVLEPGRWKAKCPAHDDGTPSLSISLADDGKILHRCFAGCPNDLVRQSAGLEWSDYWPPLSEDVVLGNSVKVGRGQAVQKKEPVHHEVYDRFLDLMTLSDGDRNALEARGLSQTAIDRAKYRTMSWLGFCRVIEPLERQFSRERILTVPGFRTDRKGKIEPVCESGLLIPVRGIDGRIVALKVRQSGRIKYRWFGGAGSPSTGNPAHFPLGVAADRGSRVTRIVEGPLKADVLTHLQPTLLTIGFPGVASWQSVLPILREIKPKLVLVAFDADWRENPSVARALVECVETLTREFKVYVETWNDAKGLDDLLSGNGGSVAAQAVESIFPSIVAASKNRTKGESKVDEFLASLTGGM